MALRFETFSGNDLTDELLLRAADFFSANYGVWGPSAVEKIGSFARPGRRVKMSAHKLRQQILPADANNTYVCALIGEEMVGNVFATRWICDGRKFCWITQLVVSSSTRRQGIATQLLRRLVEEEEKEKCGYGILSSHPAAVMATLRAFGGGLENVDMDMATKEQARTIMESSPVNYVRTAKLHGSLFEDGVDDGSISTADTNFYVDHQEPLDTLRAIRKCGRSWPFGQLPEGHEFLIMVKSSASSRTRQIATATQAEPAV